VKLSHLWSDIVDMREEGPGATGAGVIGVIGAGVMTGVVLEVVCVANGGVAEGVAEATEEVTRWISEVAIGASVNVD
jgi:hypothetical protein